MVWKLLNVSQGRSSRVSEKIALPPEVAVLVASEVLGYLGTSLVSRPLAGVYKPSRQGRITKQVAVLAALH